MNIARVCESRDHWKTCAVERRKTIECKQRQLERSKSKVAELKLAVEQRDARIAGLETQAAKAALAPLPILKVEVRVICVMMFLIGVIPCNAVTRVLDLLRATGRLAIPWIPDPSSVVNWIGRAGLGLLQNVRESATPWIAIIDTSISFGRTKALVCLRVPVDHFVRNSGAPCTADVECVGISIGEIWNGQTVHAALRKFFDKCGAPAAILKDGGSDLAKGVEHYVLELRLRNEPPPIVLRDVGHVVANALKALYKRNEVLGKFLALVEKARDLMRQSGIAALRPPKLRSKGRYQSISRVVEWAGLMVWQMGGRGRAAEGSLRGALRTSIPGLARMKIFIEKFERDCRILNDFLRLLKDNGLNPETGAQAREHLERLPPKSRMRISLLAWLASHLALHERMELGCVPLLVSSDIIETVMGKIKQVIERMPTPEFTTLTLATPLFCGRQSQETIQAAIERCSHKTLVDWRSENCSRTHRKLQRDILIAQVVADVQETPITQVA